MLAGCFYINLPLGAVAISFILLYLEIPKKQIGLGFQQSIWQLDIPGTTFFVGAITCLLLGLTWGGSRYNWRNARIIALFVLGGVFIILFILDQIWLGNKATISKRLISNRNVWGSCAFVACLGAAQFVLIYYVSKTRSFIPLAYCLHCSSYQSGSKLFLELHRWNLQS
jgi:hypothetical protein